MNILIEAIEHNNLNKLVLAANLNTLWNNYVNLGHKIMHNYSGTNIDIWSKNKIKSYFLKKINAIQFADYHSKNFIVMKDEIIDNVFIELQITINTTYNILFQTYSNLSKIDNQNLVKQIFNNLSTFLFDLLNNLHTIKETYKKLYTHRFLSQIANIKYF